MDDRKYTHGELIEEISKVHHKMPRWVLLLILLAVVIVLAYHTADLVVILLLSGLLAYMLSSLINKIQSLGLKRDIAVILLFFASISLIIGAELLLSPYLHREIGNFYGRVPEFSKQIEVALKQQSSDATKDYSLLEQVIRKILSEAMIPGRLIFETLDFSQIFGYAAPFVLGLDAYPLFRILPAQRLARHAKRPYEVDTSGICRDNSICTV